MFVGEKYSEPEKSMPKTMLSNSNDDSDNFPDRMNNIQIRVINNPSRMNNNPIRVINNIPSRMNNNPSRMNNSPVRMNNNPSRMNNSPMRMNNNPSRMNNGDSWDESDNNDLGPRYVTAKEYVTDRF